MARLGVPGKIQRGASVATWKEMRRVAMLVQCLANLSAINEWPSGSLEFAIRNEFPGPKWLNRAVNELAL